MNTRSRHLIPMLLGWSLALVNVGRPATSGSSPAAEPPVRAWEERLVIPTYPVGLPDPDPIFYSNESYQGAQKRVYPYPLQDQLSDVPEDRAYRALWLENEFVRISVLPELGGRIFSAEDRTNGYDFFYRQHVIKPALIGMLGAWISGGVEWCAFHHHRNTTFMPVDAALAANPDGSKTIWIGETERRHRMRWVVGLTLRPGRSYLEATVRFFNRTPQPHSMLYWANVAVHVNDSYQILFPPSVQVATFHSKIDFTRWPIADGVYRGIDYAGADLSWWRSSTEANSFFAWDLCEDFMGGYDHGRQAGVVHVGDHRVVCGAKLWEWGTGPAGRAWERILTDADGPYAELMVGAYSDNQPDYSWIQPYEVREATHCWYPVREIGGFKNANRDAAVNLELRSDGVALVGFHATARHRDARAVLRGGGHVLLDETIEIGPDRPFRCEVAVPAGTRAPELRAALVSAEGRELIAYQPVEPAPPAALPVPVQAPPKPAEIASVEELYLTGLRVEQIHNPTVNAIDYYEEALRRDPGDSRSLIALAIHRNRRGMFEPAEELLRRALARITAGYTRPRDGEAHYQLGLALRGRGRLDAACDQFYRAAWDQASRAAALQQLAELSCLRGEPERALDEIEQALAVNARSTKALGTKAMCLRRLGRFDEARAAAQAALDLDPLDHLAGNELALAAAARGDEPAAGAARARLRALMRDEVQSYLELATDYMSAGLWADAGEVLRRPVDARLPLAATYPMVHYYIGFLHEQAGDPDAARRAYETAARMPSDYCFPFRLESAAVLSAAIAANPADAKAHYYLGNLLFDLQPDRAIECWEKSRALDDRFAAVHRNLGWAAYRVRSDVAGAIDCYERALACERGDPRIYLELDTLYELGNAAPERRLALLEGNHEVVARRKDALLREIMVLVLAGRYETAIDYLDGNYFHAREGAEGIRDVYVDAHLLRGAELMQAGDSARALRHFERAAEYPENLSIGRPKQDRRALQILYLTAKACEALGDGSRAARLREQAAAPAGGGPAHDSSFYQALSLRELGKPEEAAAIFAELVQAGERRLAEGEPADFFAKFGEQETRRARTAAAHCTVALGMLGQGRLDDARSQLEDAVRLNASHVWARHHLAELSGDD